MGKFWNEEETVTSRIYLCIDLKSFYASVECVERGLDPLATRLVVADPERTEKTICLAVTPALKAMGIRNRCRVFEIPKSVDYIMATPRMHLYLEYSARIYGIYLKYVCKDDIHVYSVDESFLDVTDYLKMYNMNAKELGIRIMEDIYETTGITATCGIGTNLYLTKVALDITAKHVPDHIGILTEPEYCRTMWRHLPLTDFWMIGHGTERHLAKYGIHTMYDIAHADEDFLYREFGIDAELLIDHAWGRETTTMADIKKYRPKSQSLTSGQVLPRDYTTEEGLLLMKEMADLLSLKLCTRDLVTRSVTIDIGYARSSGRGYSTGSILLGEETNLSRLILPKVEELYDRVVIPEAPIRRVNMSMNKIQPESCRQLSLFDDSLRLEKERALQKTVAALQQRYGRNAVLRGMNLEEAGRTIERNGQIGGHKA